MLVLLLFCNLQCKAHARLLICGLPPAAPLAAVRGYNVGELAACRRFAEAAMELRIPLLGHQAFAFAEYGTDLGSSGTGPLEPRWLGDVHNVVP